MLKDIVDLVSKDVAIAAVHELNKEGEMVWNTYVVNFKNTIIEGVLVMSKGHGEIDGEERQTSTLRHFLDQIAPGSFAKIEPLPEDLLGFYNEYLLTYYVGSTLYDKKFVFEPYSISNKKAEYIEIFGQNGVMLS